MDSLHQDKSGYICSKEFGSLLRTLGYNPTEAEVNTLMAKVDVDHNGKVFVYLILVHSYVVVDLASLLSWSRKVSTIFLFNKSKEKQHKYCLDYWPLTDTQTNSIIWTGENMY